ncbi:5-oxoprolinase, partial [Stenotrophomonas maltophilia]
LGSVGESIRTVIAARAGTMRDGEVYALNDPYRGGTHLPDLVVVRPVLLGGEVIAVAATCLHHQDVGGMTPGSIPPNATEIYQDGLRLPPLRWRTADGIDANVQTILDANSR